MRKHKANQYHDGDFNSLKILGLRPRTSESSFWWMVFNIYGRIVFQNGDYIFNSDFVKKRLYFDDIRNHQIQHIKILPLGATYPLVIL